MQRNLSSLVTGYNETAYEFANRSVLKIRISSSWQKVIKRAVDIVVSFFGLLLLSPLMIYVAIRIKLDSPGSIFYLQQRIGYNGRPFMIFKFRSMYQNSEKNGPALSSDNDRRVTNWGRIIRKWKLDELPQLLNILLGSMSLVGPRPERKYYIDLVSVKYPYFNYLHKVKPGLTSLGMIRFGYAHNITQIIERMQYDIRYLESYSLLLDFQIIYYTLRFVLDGEMFEKALNFRVRLPQGKVSTISRPLIKNF